MVAWNDELQIPIAIGRQRTQFNIDYFAFLYDVVPFVKNKKTATKQI